MFQKISHAITSFSKVAAYIMATVEVIEFAISKYDEVTSDETILPVKEAVNADEN